MQEGIAFLYIEVMTFDSDGRPRLDHIGIAVKDLVAAARIYRLLGIEPTRRETVANQEVELLVLPLGDTRLELLQPLVEDSPMGRFIARRGEGLHHIAVAVEDIREALRQCEEAGIKILDREPRLGAEGQLIAFLNPRATGGVLIELTQGTSGKVEKWESEEGTTN